SAAVQAASVARAQPSTEVVPREPSLVLGFGAMPRQAGTREGSFCLRRGAGPLRGKTEREEGHMAIAEEVEALREQTLASIGQAADTAALDQVRVAVLGKSGTLTGYLRSMGQVPKEERAQVGKAV